MTISVYIPTDGNRLSKLDEIISIYNNGSVKPDEIVISAFAVETEEHLSYLRNIHNKKYDNVSIYAGKSLGTLAENQNNSLKFTTGDIIAYHDPEKYPCIKRIEIVKQCFETYDINTLHHTSHNRDLFLDNSFSFEHMNIIKSDELYKRYFPFNNLKDSWRYSRTYGQEFSMQVDMPSMCVSRDVVKNLKWKERYECQLYRGNDEGMYYELSMESLSIYKKSLITGSPLTIVK